MPENIHFSLVENLNRPDKSTQQYSYYQNYYVYNMPNPMYPFHGQPPVVGTLFIL